MSSIFLIALALIPIALFLFAHFLARRPRRRSPRIKGADPVSDKARFGFPHGDAPFVQRERTLKVCPDCRELELLEANQCRYCGCTLGVAEAAVPHLTLRNSRGAPAQNEKRKAPPQSLHFPR